MIIRYKNKISTRKKKERNTCDLWGTVSLQLVAASLAAAVAHAWDRWVIGEAEGHRHADRKLLPAGRPAVIDARHGRDTRQKPAGSPDRRWRRRRLARPQAQCTHSQRYDGVPINRPRDNRYDSSPSRLVRHQHYCLSLSLSPSIANSQTGPSCCWQVDDSGWQHPSCYLSHLSLSGICIELSHGSPDFKSIQTLSP